MRLASLAVLFLALPLFAADEKPAVKEVPTKDLKVAFPEKFPGVKNLETITSADDLAKSAMLKGAADDIKKQIDFKTEKLVAFAWQGSGGDKLAVELRNTDGKQQVVFLVTPGLTFDLRQHVKLYAVPKDAEVLTSTAK